MESGSAASAAADGEPRRKGASESEGPSPAEAQGTRPMNPAERQRLLDQLRLVNARLEALGYNFEDDAVPEEFRDDPVPSAPLPTPDPVPVPSVPVPSESSSDRHPKPRKAPAKASAPTDGPKSRTKQQGPPSPKPAQCPYCSKVIQGASTLEVHIRSHTGEKPFKCTVAKCGKAFSQSGSFSRHLRSHGGAQSSAKGPGQPKSRGETKRHQCPTCSKAFKDPSHLKAHSVVHTGEKPHVCSKCDRAFNQQRNLRRHVLHQSCFKGPASSHPN